MAEIKRTSLEWARDIARAYRWKLLIADPEECRRLDEQARAVGQRWIAPHQVPADAADQSGEAIMSPGDIEYLWGIPAATLYGWAAKGLLTNHGRKGAPLYRVSEVRDVEARRRKTA